MDTTKMLSELYTIFNLVNKDFFNDELECPVILIQKNTKRKSTAYGWVTVKEVWTNKEETEKRRELTIASEFLTREIEEIIGTMLHEMVHLYNLKNNIQDCSRNNTYHNKKFKEQAEKFGLIVEKSKKYGWAHTQLSTASLERANKYNINKEVFNAYRLLEKTTKQQKANSRKYVCPTCGNIIRATKEINVICGDCDTYFVEEF